MYKPDLALNNQQTFICHKPKTKQSFCCILMCRVVKTDAGSLLYKYMYLSLYCKGSKRLFKVCVWESVGDWTETSIFWPPLLWPSTLCLSRSPDAQPEALGFTLLSAGFLYCILSASSLDPNSPGLPEGPLCRVWLSLPHLASHSHWNSNSTVTVSCLLSWLSYIIVQRPFDRPLDRPLDLWNGMIDRHPAEITVMQFTGHSLPVHQSMSVSWALPCPISSANFRPRDFLS